MAGQATTLRQESAAVLAAPLAEFFGVAPMNLTVEGPIAASVAAPAAAGGRRDGAVATTAAAAATNTNSTRAGASAVPAAAKVPKTNDAKTADAQAPMAPPLKATASQAPAPTTGDATSVMGSSQMRRASGGLPSSATQAPGGTFTGRSGAAALGLPQDPVAAAAAWAPGQPVPTSPRAVDDSPALYTGLLDAPTTASGSKNSSSSFDSAPTCRGALMRSSSVADATGRMLGWRNGGLCAFRAIPQAPAEPRSVLTWAAAPLCEGKPSLNSAAVYLPEGGAHTTGPAELQPDAGDHLWGWQRGVSCAYRGSEQQPFYGSTNPGFGALQHLLSVLPGRLTPLWEAAEPCTTAPRVDSIVWDKFGRGWSTSGDKLCAFKVPGNGCRRALLHLRLGVSFPIIFICLGCVYFQYCHAPPVHFAHLASSGK